MLRWRKRGSYEVLFMVRWCIPAYDYVGAVPGVYHTKNPLSYSLQKRFEA